MAAYFEITLDTTPPDLRLEPPALTGHTVSVAYALSDGELSARFDDIATGSLPMQVGPDVLTVVLPRGYGGRGTIRVAARDDVWNEAREVLRVGYWIGPLPPWFEGTVDMWEEGRSAIGLDSAISLDSDLDLGGIAWPLPPPMT